jgi:hypothetical protein
MSPIRLRIYWPRLATFSANAAFLEKRTALFYGSSTIPLTTETDAAGSV